MTDFDILIEYEAQLANAGEPIKTCPKCGIETHRVQCPDCKNPDGTNISLSGDSEMDDLQTRIEAGEEIENFEELLRGTFVPLSREDACLISE
jgi:hypothetical protein